MYAMYDDYANEALEVMVESFRAVGDTYGFNRTRMVQQAVAYVALRHHFDPPQLSHSAIEQMWLEAGRRYYRH